jgi:hypothetical protein
LPGNPAIERVPANELDPDSDLGDRMVTVDVPLLLPTDILDALAAGMARAEAFIADGTIAAATLYLGGQAQTAGNWPIRGVIVDFSPNLPIDLPRQPQAGPL